MNFFTSIAKKSTFVLIATVFSAMAASALTTTDGENPAIGTPEPKGHVVYQTIIVTKTEKSIILDWNTASEYMNNYFEVERSSNATDFKTVALVLDGFSTEGTGKKYAFKEDASVTKAGTVFYRLKQVDEYGNANYSAVVKVK